MPGGGVRNVQGRKASSYIRRVVWGKYMDIISAGGAGGSSTTYYADYYTYEPSTARVVYRSRSNANVNGGVSFASAVDAASVANAVIGSRLAFRGTLVRAESVEAYLAATAIS